MTGDLFVVGVVALQTLATFFYLAAGDWKQAIVWGGVAVSNVAYLSLVRL